MPDFTHETPRSTYKVLGADVTFPNVYAAGHTLTEAEARFVNTRIASIMVNALGGDIRRAQAVIDAEREKAFKAKKYTGPMTEDGKKPAPATLTDTGLEVQSLADKKFGQYKVGEANTRVATPTDPVEAVARTIAVNEVKAALKRKGLKAKPLMDQKNAEHGSEFNRIVHERLAGHKERIPALAKAQIESATSADDDLGLAA